MIEAKRDRPATYTLRNKPTVTGRTAIAGHPPLS
jgi:rRNA maturation protein Nop10